MVWRRNGIAIAALAGSISHAHAEWGPSTFDGEASKAAMGCSDSITDESWLCLAVRCDAPGRIGVYVDLTNIDLLGRMKVTVDGTAFEVEAGDAGAAPYSTRFVSPVESLVNALKKGKAARLSHPQQEITKGYDLVPLRKAGQAIGKVEAACR